MKTKNYYYVLVFTDSGPVYVTGIPSRNCAQWKRTEKPKDLSKTMAEEMAYGLNLNGYRARMVVSPHEIDVQEYRYQSGTFEWVEKDTVEEKRTVQI